MPAPRKNVLVIVLDDLRADLDALLVPGTPSPTPNIDALARQGVAFANAVAPVPQCSPSRTTALTGLQPTTTHVIQNRVDWWRRVDLGATLPARLQAEGYLTVGAGKVFHELPADVAPSQFDLALSAEGGEGEDRGDPFAVTVHEGPGRLRDEATVDAVLDGLPGMAADGRPFFLAVGLSNPHLPLIARQADFDRFPRGSIVLPEGPADDLDDLPPLAIDEIASENVHRRLVREGRWDDLVQGYLAEAHAADRQVGRLIEGLRDAGVAEDTTIVLWSDHGFHLGEKQHWRKNTLWDVSLRASLVVVDPDLAPGSRGEVVEDVVSLVDLYPTLLDLLDLGADPALEGRSFAPLLRGEATRGSFAVSESFGNFSLRTEAWHYIRYVDGSEELYDSRRDPGEFVNLVATGERAAAHAKLAAQLDGWLAREGVLVAHGRLGPLVGGARGESLYGGGGSIGMIGGRGDDFYLVDDAGDRVVERPGGGRDLAFLIDFRTYALPNGVEDGVWYTSGGGFDGNALDNVLLGARRLRGLGGDDTLDGGNGDDVLEGGIGDDRLLAGAGDDLADGGAGAGDLYDAGASYQPVAVDLAAGRAFGPTTGEDRLVGVEGAIGGGGGDILKGGGGSDALEGGGGADAIEGGAGRDRLSGGAGDDSLRGNGAVDTFLFEPGGGVDLVEDFTDGADLLSFEGFGAGFDTAAEILDMAVQDGADMRITIPNPGPGNTVVVLKGFDLADLTAADFGPIAA